MEKQIKRGYVKWTDENGVFHKEPLADHPELLADASPRDQLQAEEVRRLNAAAEEFTTEREESAEDQTREALQDLKAAPADVLTAADLPSSSASAPEDTGEKTEEVESLQKPAAMPDASIEEVKKHDEALAELRENTTE